MPCQNFKVSNYVMKLLIMDTLNQFDLLCSICQNHGNSLLYIICQQIQDSSFIDKTMNSYVCISLIFGLISFKFRIIIQIAKIKSFKQKKEIKIKILLKKKSCLVLLKESIINIKT